LSRADLLSPTTSLAVVISKSVTHPQPRHQLTTASDQHAAALPTARTVVAIVGTSQSNELSDGSAHTADNAAKRKTYARRDDAVRGHARSRRLAGNVAAAILHDNAIRAISANSG